MSDRLEVVKTGKLFIGGASPRSESGRTYTVEAKDGRVLARIALASRKDSRDAVEAARKGLAPWRDATAYLRGQVLYRWAEMLEGRSAELTQMLQDSCSHTVAAARRETTAAVDRLVSMAGWCDKLDQVLGCRNAVAGNFHNHTVPQARGVMGVFCPQTPPLLGMVTMIAAALVPGNAVVAVIPRSAGLCAVMLGEMLAVSDVPAGAVNLLTGDVEELLEPLGGHGEVHGLVAAGLSKGQRASLRHAAADSVIRPVHCVDLDAKGFANDALACSPWLLDALVDHKTIWHPSST